MEENTMTTEPKKQSKLMLVVGFLICALLFAGVGLGVGYLLFNNTDSDKTTIEETNETSEDEKKTDSDDNISNCSSETYSNQYYPKLTFSYDSCKWSVEEDFRAEVDTDRDMIYVNYKDDSNVKISFQLVQCPMGGGYPSCANTDYQVINSTYAWIYSEGDGDYFLSNTYALKGTDDFAGYSEILIPDPASYANICYSSDLDITTETTKFDLCGQIYIKLTKPSDSSKTLVFADANELIQTLGVK